MNLNAPIWNPSNPKTQGAFQESWHLRVNDPSEQRALWLNFAILISSNGFRRVAETTAIFVQRSKGKELTKIVVKQVQPLQGFSYNDQAGLKMSECVLSAHGTRGQIQSKGQTVQWNLNILPAADQRAPFSAVPETLTRGGFVRNSMVTVHEELTLNGTIQVNGEKYDLRQAHGMQGHFSGPQRGHSWVWAHCNSFQNERGEPVPFIVEGLCARGRLLGPVPSPRLSSFYFRYQGKDYFFNSLLDAIRVRSKNSLNEWEFQADRGDLSFRGKARAEHKDFVGLTYEDTNGSLLYGSNSQLSDLQVLVYRRGKIEASLQANGTAAFEVVGRNKNPYVPLLI